MAQIIPKVGRAIFGRKISSTLNKSVDIAKKFASHCIVNNNVLVGFLPLNTYFYSLCSAIISWILLFMLKKPDTEILQPPKRERVSLNRIFEVVSVFFALKGV